MMTENEEVLHLLLKLDENHPTCPSSSGAAEQWRGSRKHGRKLSLCSSGAFEGEQPGIWGQHSMWKLLCPCASGTWLPTKPWRKTLQAVPWSLFHRLWCFREREREEKKLSPLIPLVTSLRVLNGPECTCHTSQISGCSSLWSRPKHVLVTEF